MKNIEEPILSVIIPSYNVSDFIKTSVSSALNQKNLEVEVVIIDDGSKDNLKDVVSKEFGDYSNVKYYRQDNKGLYKTRIEGARKATGKYITFIDADDYVEKNFYLPLIERMERENLDIIEFGYYRVDGQGNIISKFSFFEEYKDKLKAIKRIVNKSNCMCSVCNKIYKREIFDVDTLKQYEAKKYEEDLFTNLVIIEKAKGFLTVSDVGYYYVVRDGSITNSNICYKESVYLASWKYIYSRYKDDECNAIIANGYCSRIAFSYCMARKNKYEKNELIILKNLFKEIFSRHNLKHYKYEYESRDRKYMIKLFHLSPTICYLVFLIRNKK